MQHNFYIPKGIDLAAQRMAAIRSKDKATVHLHAYGEHCAGEKHEYYDKGEQLNGREPTAGEVS